jgi:PPOX class probable F420-dependent enzyme
LVEQVGVDGDGVHVTLPSRVLGFNFLHGRNPPRGSVASVTPDRQAVVMDEQAARAAVAAARVARLATVSAVGAVDLVPITFALVTSAGRDRLVTAVDHKPKSTTRLQRLADVRAHPEVSVLVDQYDDDWSRLWWVRLRGVATLVESGAEHTEAIDALRARYAPYRDRRPTGPAILVDLTRWQWWSAS